MRDTPGKAKPINHSYNVSKIALEPLAQRAQNLDVRVTKARIKAQVRYASRSRKKSGLLPVRRLLRE
jgi:hypothetical protein